MTALGRARRMLTAATVAGLSFATFAGCSPQSPVPDPSATALACNPATSTISWSHGFAPDPVLIGVYVLQYDYDAKRWASTYHAIPVSPSWDDQAIPQVSSSIPAQQEWRAALLADAAKTGQVPTDFGAIAKINPTDVDSPSGVPTRPDKHILIEALTANQYTMPFTVACGKPSGRTVQGSVTASLTGAWASTFYQCGNEPSSELERLALRYCPAGQ